MTSIIPTIGPQLKNKNNLKYLFKFASCIRLNGSHNTLDWHKRISKKIKKINPKSIILFDIPGVKPRTANVFKVKIKKNEEIVFFYKIKPKLSKSLKYIEITNPIPSLRNKKNFSVNDGEFQFKFTKIRKNYFVGKSNSNIILLPKKGINIPNTIYDNNLQETKILNFIDNAINYGIKFDSIGVSFVQNEKILKKIKIKYPKYLIVSKIENIEGVKNAEKIIKNSDGIMIDRGDLAAEIADHNLYKQINRISYLSKKYSKFLIMATHNLISMKTRMVPTKSEVFALGLSITICDQIMLSDETAVYKNWKNIIEWLNAFLNNSKNK